MGRNLHRLIHHRYADGSPYPEDACPVFDVMRTGHGTRVADEVFWRRDGAAFPVDYAANPVAEDGAIPGAVVTFRDVTERKRVEAALHGREARFRSLVQNASDVITVIDATGTVRYISPSIQQVMGYRPEDLIGSRIWDRLHPDDLVRVREAFATCVQTPGAARAIELRYRRADGTWRVVEAIGTNLLNDPNVRGVVLNSRDITERKHAEEERERLLNREQAARAEAEVAQRHSSFLAEQLAILVEASGTLLSSPMLSAVLPAILDLSRRLIAADAYAVWRYQSAIGEWGVVSTVGLSEEYRLAAVRAMDHAEQMPDEPLVIEDPSKVALIARLSEAHQAEGIKSLLVLPLKIRGSTCGTLVFYYRQRHQFDAVEVRVASALANLAAASIGIAELYDEQSQMGAEAEAARKNLAFLAKASELLVASLDYPSTLQRVAHLAVSHLADWCFFDVVEGDGSIRRLLAHRDTEKVGWAREEEQRSPFDLAEPREVSRLLRTGHPEIYPEISNSMLADVAGDGEYLQTLRRLGCTSVMIVPLVAHGRTLGAVTFVSCESDHHYTSADFALAEDLARRAALAVDNARLYDQLQDLVGRLLVAQEEERRRVAYEVHDELAQLAAGTHQHLQAFADDHRPRSSLARAELDNALLLAQRTVREARRVVANLRPTVLDDFGLTAAIRLQVEELRAEGWEVDYRETLGEERLPPAVETALFRVAQEALRNVRKHAQSTRVRVTLECREQATRLEVQDWGRGFDTGAARQESGVGERVGLPGMRERIALLGGWCTIESQPGIGTRVVAEIPLSAPQRDAIVAER